MTKPVKWLHPAKTQISIRPVLAESLQCAQWVAKDPTFLHAHCKDSDQTGQMPRLIWVFTGRTVILLVLSWGGSNDYERMLPTSLETYGILSRLFMMVSHKAYIFQFSSLRMAIKPADGFSTTFLRLISILGPVSNYFLQYNQSTFGLLFNNNLQKHGPNNVTVVVYLSVLSKNKNMNFFLLHKNLYEQEHLQCLFFMYRHAIMSVTQQFLSVSRK